MPANPTASAFAPVRRIVTATVLAAAVIFFGAASAHAYWDTEGGTGTGEASTGTLDPATDVTAVANYGDVTVTWTAPDAPDGGNPTGYYVTRYAGTTPSDACGTDASSPSTYLDGSTLSCVDTVSAAGTYVYTVTAVYRTWSTESDDSNALTVSPDNTAPTMSITLASGATNAYLGGTNLYYRAAAAGSFHLNASVTDSTSGPGGTDFPAISTTGWTHPDELVTTGTGTLPTLTYASSAYSWTANPSAPPAQTITGFDQVDNPVTIPVTFVSDNTAPTGGTLTVNSVSATWGGSTSYNKTGSFTIGSRVNYATDSGSGVSTSVLTLQSATLTNGMCGALGSPTTLTGSPSQSGLATGCYRYTLTGTDRVGNAASITTTVLVDTTVPTQTLSIASATNAYYAANRVYFRGTVAGSFIVTTAVTDADSGPVSETFPAIATTGWTHNAETVTVGSGAAPTITYSSQSYSWTANPSTPSSKSYTGANLVGGTVATAVTFKSDVTAPKSGALTANGTTATAAGSSSWNTSGSFTLTRTDWTEAQTTAASGLASSILTLATAPISNGTCGTYGAASVVAGAPAQSGLTTGCYLYTLTGTDNVGNATAKSVTLKVDTGVPVGGALTVAGTAATSAGSVGTLSSASATITRTDWTDPDSGISSSTLVRTQVAMTNGVCGPTYGTNTTITGTTTQTLSPRICYKFTLTGTNAAGGTSVISTVIMVQPYVTAVALTNGTHTAGVVDQGDKIVVTFSDPINPQTMCSAWTTSGNQSITGNNQSTVTLSNGASDSIAVSSSLCTFNFGTLSLGSTAYTTATQTFAGTGANASTITWTASTNTLTIVLGALTGTASPAVASSAVTYTPSTNVANANGIAEGGTFTTATIKQF
jgi:hypothetical protein